MTLRLGGDGAITGCTSLEEPTISISGLTMTTPIEAVSGTAAAPSYTFSGDTDNGLYYAGSNSIGLSTAGNNAILIDSSGRVGIGTTSPSAPLDVVGNDGIAIQSSAQTNEFLIRPGGSSADGIRFTQAGGAGDRIVIDSSGNVGIGTTNPSTILHIKNNAPYIRLEDINDNQDWEIRGTSRFNIFDITNGTERFSIDSSGKVGIGTSTSRASLTVAKGGSSIPAAGANTASAVFSNDADAGVYGLIAGANASGTGYLQAQRTDGNAIVYPLAIQPNGGNVGIGTTSPTAPLTVNQSSGNINLELHSSTSGRGTQIKTHNDHATFFHGLAGDTTGEYIYYTADAKDHVFSTSNSEALRIDSDGSVGIGTGAAINLTAAGRQTLALNGNNETAISLSHSGSLAAFLYTSSTEFRMQSEISIPLVFRANNSEAMRIDVNGLVGIGTSSATAHSSSYDGSGLQVHNGASGKGVNLRLTCNVTGPGAGGGSYLAVDGVNRSFYIYNKESAPIVFGPGNSEKVRITTSTDGQLLVGNTTGSSSAGIGVKLTGGGAATVDVVLNASSNVNINHVYNINATRNGYRYYLSADGGIRNFSGNNVNLSDEREKKNIVDMDSPWNELKQWTLRQFHFNSQDDSEDKCYGVIAQQIETVSPQVLSTFDTNATTTRKGVKEQKMMWMAIKALQEAMAKIETLEAKVAALET